MALTYPQLVAIGAVLSARGTTFQHLLKAVDKEVDKCRARSVGNESEYDKMSTEQNGPGGAINTSRSLTATQNLEGDAQQL